MGARPLTSRLHAFPDPTCVLGAVASRVTPAFVFDPAVAQARHAQMLQAIERAWGPATVGFSWKTNPEIARLRPFPGALAEVVSPREYEEAIEAGFTPSQIIVNGPGHPLSFHRQALEDGARVHLDHEEEWWRLPSSGASKGRLGLRVRPQGPGLPRSRFGIPPDRLFALAKQTGAPTLSSVHVHLGTDVDDPQTFQAAAQLVGRLYTQLRRVGVPLDTVDLGGGFPGRIAPHGRSRYHPRDLATYMGALGDGLRGVTTSDDLPHLILEPGRTLVEDAVVFVSRVLRVDGEPDGQDVLLDAVGSMLPHRLYRPLVPRACDPTGTPLRGSRQRTRLWGRSCVERDLLFEGPLPPMTRGNYVLFYGVGAYHQSFAGTFLYDRPPMYVLKE